MVVSLPFQFTLYWKLKHCKSSVLDKEATQGQDNQSEIYMSKQFAENRRKECHRFWLRLRHAVILISNDRTSASKKINGMALI